MAPGRMDTDVVAERRGPLGLVLLNRPRALNALSLPMIRGVQPALEAWARDPAVHAVVIRGEGGRAFCAGGDVRAVAQTPGLAPDFFREEYRLNHAIHHFPKPFVALVDGISMGGGLGLSAHGSHRVVTERLVLAMPETAIGLFPDVGGGWFLPRFPGEAGTYLGLTGARASAADARWLGYATHHTRAERLPALLDALAEADFSAAPARAVVDGVLARFDEDAGPSPLAERAADLDRLFAFERVEDVLAALERHGGAWAVQTRETLGRMCPTSLAVTLRQLRLGRGMAYDDMARLEYRLALRMTARADFQEGIRAVLVDKDGKARWQARASDAELDALFAPLPAHEEWAP